MDPYEVLGLSPAATDHDIRAAYLSRVKDHPPDRSPEAFEQIRDAYEQLRDPRQRARHVLLGVDPGEPLTRLLAGSESPRRFVGPGPWLEVLNPR